MTKLIVTGAAGRMGRQVLAAALEDRRIEVVAGLVRPGSDVAGTDLGVLAGRAPVGIPCMVAQGALPAAADVVLDFSQPAAAVLYAAAAAAAGCAFLTGTTGLSPEQRGAIEAHATRIPVTIAPNTSLGLTALLDVLPALVAALGSDYDIEIIETHHRFKADAPSGTALALAHALADATGNALTGRAVYGRQGPSPRMPGEIGVHAVRAGGAVGEHRVIIASEGEQLEFIHRATNRQTYAAGAIRAALWLAGQPPGRYTMHDALVAGR